jgi:hypothetical protein
MNSRLDALVLNVQTYEEYKIIVECLKELRWANEDDN